MGKKSSRKKADLELETILAPVIKMREEIESHVFKMARTHKFMSTCPCIACFSEIVFDFIYDKYEEPFSRFLYEEIMNQVSKKWDLL
ncbi:hypothetical protein PLEI_0291 [Photobacterium leiognathi lrivu.4.1]|uniref:Uncharacterized protein n=1 Tax=Photobacterium leiognathi lrivu.4.1 TaxID=1248232 RepID=V5F1I6_PHOLE|nr:hypothetical protein [Photobacterium leiognathi]GAD28648.1 hypothetical protein PLEI_0291 [Photobacterium leiognathi lrivu.4.1]